MSISDDDRLAVLLDDLRHEIKRLNENLERSDEDTEVQISDEHR